MIPDIAKDLDKLRKYVVNRRLVGIPSEVRAKVKETPQYLRATSFASMDTPGPFEKRATEAYYYVTPTEEDWPEKEKQEWLTAFNYYTSDIVSIHEVYPGHYVQFLHLNESPASKVEKTVWQLRLHRRLGALLRKNDDRRRLRQRGKFDSKPKTM